MQSVGAILLVALLALLSFVLRESAVSRMDGHTLVVNETGHQRARLQRTLLLAHLLTDPGDVREREALRAELRRKIDEFESAHERLALAAGRASSGVRDLYFGPEHGVDHRAREYVATVRGLLSGKHQSLGPDAGTEVLAAELNALVERLVRESQEELAWLQQLSAALLVGELIAVVLITAAVIVPMLRRLRREILTLRETNRLLDERTHELARSRASALNILEDVQRARSEAERLAAIVATSGDAIVGQDLDGAITSWNSGAERLFGYTASEMIGNPITILAPPEHAREAGQLLARVRSGETVEQHQAVRMRRDGRRVHVSITASPTRAKDGLIVGVSLIGRDVTDRVAAEEKLRESEARSRLVIDTALDAVITIDAGGYILDWNSQAERIFGWARSEALGRSLATTIVPPQHRDAHVAGLARFLATGEGVVLGRRIEIEALRRGGEEFPVELSISAIQRGETWFFTAFVRDITERKRAEERFQRAVEAAPNAMIMVDTEGTMVLVNSQTERLFGYARSELLGQPIELLVPHSVRNRHPDLRASFLDRPEARAMGVERDLRGLHKDGHEVPVEIGLNPITTREGTLVLASIIDVAGQRRRASAEIQRYARALERSNRELDDFAYVASHDLREPLRGISNYAKFLIEDYGDRLDDAGRERLEALPRLCARLDSLIDALLQYSRMGRVELAAEPTDMDALVREVLDGLAALAAERGVEIRLAGPLPTVACHAVLAQEVFANLVSNATKYNDKPEKWVEIGCVSGGANGAATEGPPVFYVRDNGIGIREKHVDSIFRIFKRLHARDAFGGGAGAGLTVAKKIVERHGGRLWVESGYGEGSTFYFTLGRGADEAAMPAEVTHTAHRG